MIVRPARRDDFAEIARLQTASWQVTYRGHAPDHGLDVELPPTLAEHWTTIEVRPDDLVLVAEDDGIVGFAAIWCRPEPYLDNLHVRPGTYGRGIGRALMARAAGELLGHGQTTLRLSVLEANQRALRFYLALGGEVVARQPEPMCGVDLTCLEIAWTDLRVLAARSGAACDP